MEIKATITNAEDRKRYLEGKLLGSPRMANLEISGDEEIVQDVYNALKCLKIYLLE